MRLSTSAMKIATRDITIAADDGVPLAAQLFLPPADTGTGPLTVVASATGVPQRYYSRFASYLAEQGRPTVTFDGRGIGRSAPTGVCAAWLRAQ